MPSSAKRCTHKIYNPQTGKSRRCSNKTQNGLCHVHWKFGNIGKEDGEEFGICCYCNEKCNPCSQSCGACPRRFYSKQFFTNYAMYSA